MVTHIQTCNAIPNTHASEAGDLPYLQYDPVVNTHDPVTHINEASAVELSVHWGQHEQPNEQPNEPD